MVLQVNIMNLDRLATRIFYIFLQKKKNLLLTSFQSNKMCLCFIVLCNPLHTFHFCFTPTSFSLSPGSFNSFISRVYSYMCTSG